MLNTFIQFHNKTYNTWEIYSKHVIEYSSAKGKHVGNFTEPYILQSPMTVESATFTFCSMVSSTKYTLHKMYQSTRVSNTYPILMFG